MSSDNEHFNHLIRLLLPREIFDFFDIVSVAVQEKEVHIHIDEKAIKPEGYELVNLMSKGFHKASIVQDFPLRDRVTYLHVRRRRWYCESTKNLVERDWDTVAKGTRLTKEFATFLKGAFGYLPHQQ